MMKYLIVLLIAFSSAFLLNAQWIQTNGPLGGNFGTLSLHENQIFATGGSGGFNLFVSSNNGVKWDNKSNGQDIDGVYKMTFINNRIVAISRTGIVVSTDNGETWATKNNSLTNKSVFDIIVKDSLIFAVSGDLFLSADFGETWTQTKYMLNATAKSSPRCISVKNDKIFVGSGSPDSPMAIGVSTDNGESWEAATSSLGNTKVNKLAIKDSLIFAGTGGGLYVTNIDSLNWQYVNGIPYRKFENIACDSTRVIACTSTELYISTNNGNDWADISKGIKANFIRDILIVKDFIFVSTSSGLYKSADNGNNWELLNENLSSTLIYDLKSNENVLYAGTDETGISSSSDNGANWTRIDKGFNNTSVINIAVDNNNTLATTYGFINSKELYFSDNMGADWKLISNNITTSAINYCVFFKGKMYITTAERYLLSSGNNGVTWENSDSIHSYGLKVYEDVIYSYTTSGIRYSSDGIAWNALSIDLDKMRIYNLGINESTMITQVIDSGFYLSKNNGKNWVLMSDEFKKNKIYDYLINGSNILISVYQEGVFLSQDYGKTWISKNKGLSNKYPTKFTANGDSIFLGTLGSGVFKTKLSDITGVEDKVELRDDLFYYPPYPIPVTSGTVRSLIYWDMSIDIDKDEISVYNIYGEKVSGRDKITIEKLNGYSGYLIWDCTNFENGTYLIQIKHSTISRILKILINR